MAMAVSLLGVALPVQAAPVLTGTIEDTSVGTGMNQVSYSGLWPQCRGCAPPTPNNSFRYSSTNLASATLRFTGTQLRIYAIMNPHGGLATISVDGAPSTTVDTYAAISADRLIYTSPVLLNGSHTATLVNIGQRNNLSDSTIVSFDRAETFVDPDLPPVDTITNTIEDNVTGVGNDQVSYTGSWVTCGGCVPPTPNNTFRYSTVAGSTATIRFTGTQITIYGIREPHGGQMSISVDFGLATLVDTYAPTSSVATLFTSRALIYGTHTLQILNTGQRNPASDSTVTAFDRAGVAATAPPVNPLPPPPVGANRSGLPWLSGVNGDPLNTPAAVNSFCASRGSLCDLAHVYVARNSWGAIVDPSFAEQNFAGWPGRLLISVPAFPENTGSSLAACATGAYDSYWRTFGNTLNSTGRQNSIIRIAWQANGNWFQWAAYDANSYVGCWRHIATAIRATANPDPILDWTINAHYSQLPPSHNPLDLYPGDAYVDSIGIDSYDHYPSSPTLAAFNAQANAVGGLTWLYNFARTHGKNFGVGEWGVAPGSGVNGGGDNATYIQFMYEWLSARAGQGLLYEAYFNNCDPGNVGSNLFRPLSTACIFRNSNSDSRYTSLWRNPASIVG
ncbi:endoglucanase [Frankia sp. AiPa1]|nr:endoglucanase [Frankia sp. AiPa1]